MNEEEIKKRIDYLKELIDELSFGLKLVTNEEESKKNRGLQLISNVLTKLTLENMDLNKKVKIEKDGAKELQLDYLNFLVERLEMAKSSLKMSQLTNSNSQKRKDNLEKRNRKQAIECINIVQNALSEDIRELENEEDKERYSI